LLGGVESVERLQTHCHVGILCHQAFEDAAPGGLTSFIQGPIEDEKVILNLQNAVLELQHADRIANTW